jgi:hypothetical protein
MKQWEKEDSTEGWSIDLSDDCFQRRGDRGVSDRSSVFMETKTRPQTFRHRSPMLICT